MKEDDIRTVLSSFAPDFMAVTKQSKPSSSTVSQYTDSYLSAMQSYDVPRFDSKPIRTNNLGSNEPTTPQTMPVSSNTSSAKKESASSAHDSFAHTKNQPQSTNSSSNSWTNTIYTHANKAYTYAQSAAQSYVNSLPNAKDAFFDTMRETAFKEGIKLFARYPLATTAASAGLLAGGKLYRALGLPTWSLPRRTTPTRTHVQPVQSNYSHTPASQSQVAQQVKLSLQEQPILFSAAGAQLLADSLHDSKDFHETLQQLNNAIQEAATTTLKSNAEYDLQLEALSKDASVRAAGNPYNSYTKACADAVESACEISSDLNGKGFAQQASAIRNLAEAMNLAADAKVNSKNTGAAFTSASRPEAITIKNITHVLQKSFAGLHQASSATKDAFVKAYRDFKAQPNEDKIRDVAVASIAVMLSGAPASPLLIAALVDHVTSVLTAEFAVASAPGPIACSWQAIAEETSVAFQPPAVVQPSVMAAHAQTLQAGVNALAAAGAAQPAPLSMFGVSLSAPTNVSVQNAVNTTAGALQPTAATPNPAATLQPPAVIQPPAAGPAGVQVQNTANAVTGVGQTHISAEFTAWESSIAGRTSLIPKDSGNTIKEFHTDIIRKYWSHVFSPKHIEGGILSLGKDKGDIINKFIDVILKADARNLLREQNNHIETIIDSTNVIIKTFIKDGRVISIDGYAGITNRIIPNVIKI